MPPPVLSVVVVDPAELDGAVQRLGLLAGEGVGRVVAGEGLLVEDGLVAADEGPLRVVDDVAAGVLERQADVEDLAVVGDVGVVAVGPRLAGEGLLHGRGEDVLGGVGELVAAGVLLREAQLQEGRACLLEWQNDVQRPAKKCANLAMQDPGWARQKSQATAG